MLTHGPNAYQEVRGTPGLAWVCVVGRQAVDGSFEEFVDGLGEPEFSEDGVGYRNLSLHWDLPFTVDGRPVRPEPYHLDNPVCRVPFDATEMTIGDHVIDLRTGRAAG